MLDPLIELVSVKPKRHPLDGRPVVALGIKGLRPPYGEALETYMNPTDAMNVATALVRAVGACGESR